MQKKPYLIFIVSGKHSIDTVALKEVEAVVGNKKAPHLYLVLQSYGGDPFSAVAIINILQKNFDKISVIIPDYAKSAATLMSLGADEIYMADKASLGPLDLPIEHPKDGSRISALDVQQTITSLSSLSESIAAQRYNFLRDDRKMSKADAAKLALSVATEFVKPVVEQIDPYHLQKANRELKIGMYYAIDMLSSRMMKGNYSQARKTAQSLVSDYPAHEYAIFADEAKNVLHLKVEPLNSLKDYEEYIKKDFCSLDEKYFYSIKYFEPKNEEEKPAISAVTKAGTVTSIKSKKK